MKIAVASMQDEVSQHFGHCEKFMIFEINDGISHHSVEEIINPTQHSHGQLPTMLMQHGVKCGHCRGNWYRRKTVVTKC
jgi:predicted Fe-Mo cluster-binding NifX family protein